MTFGDYLKHYFSFPQVLLFLVVSSLIVCLLHFVLLFIAKYRMKGKAIYEEDEQLKEADEESVLDLAKLFTKLIEEYYEAMFSSSCILFFIGIYFLISYHYFSLPKSYYVFWQTYEDYILLAFILFSIILNNLMDHVLIPLKSLGKETRGILRMASMLYMLIIFLFVKFVYQDDNYDKIIGYFLTLVIGRFIYFDASVHEFFRSMKKIKEILPSVLLVLISSALLALYGFSTEYLLKSNGVILSLFIAHFFCILEILVLSKTKAFVKLAGKMEGKHSKNE